MVGTTDWQRLLDQIGSEHDHILRNTLPTPSFCFLLEARIRDCNMQLQELDLSRPADEFKGRYQSIRLQRDLAETLLEFVKSFNTKL